MDRPAPTFNARSIRMQIMTKPLALLSVCSLACAAIIGCSRDTRPTETIATMDELPSEIRDAVLESPDLKLGFAVYSRNCVGCHGIKGDGAGPAADRLTIAPRNFTTGVFKFRSTPNGQLPLDEDLHRTIKLGLKGSSMPAFEFMPERERSAVIAFIKLYSPKWKTEIQNRQRVILPSAAPDNLLTEERVWRGRYAYVGMGCQHCHGMTGRGDGASAFALRDDWNNPVRPYNYHRGAPKGGATPMDIYRTFRTGVTPMPNYQSSTLGLVTRDLKPAVFGSLVPEEQALIAPYVDSLPTQAEVEQWSMTAPERYEQYSDERAWDLVAYTLWLREQSKPVGEHSAAIWPERRRADAEESAAQPPADGGTETAPAQETTTPDKSGSNGN